jgi:hypothetical protein
MRALAMIIGIDDYPLAPLTSAVSDAVAFRHTLIALNLVTPADVILLTSPARDEGELATRTSIMARLKEVYDEGAAYDRLYLFFAGHGLSGFIDGASSVTQTLLVPPEVVVPAADPNLLINFDDLRHRLERAGPRQQFLFFDACRDLAFGEHPVNIPNLGWSAAANPARGNVAQSTLFAVSPGGQALGLGEGLGVMTAHVIDALHGRGQGLGWDDQHGHVVTAQSIAEHVCARIEEAAETHLRWRQQIMVPEPRYVGGPFEPIRQVPHPPPASLTLTYEPPNAHATTTVKLTLRGQAVVDPAWPPTGPLERAPAGPFSYRICPTNPSFAVFADPDRIDLRIKQDAVIRLVPPDEMAAEPSPGGAEVEVDGTAPPPARGATGDNARVRTDSGELGTVVELVGTDSPYARHEGTMPLSEEVAPGSYLMRFRQGTEVYSEVELDLLAGQDVHVTPGGARSPLLSEAGVRDRDGAVRVSSNAGRVRSGTLSTVLTLLGLLPYDEAGMLDTPFAPLIVDRHAIALRGSVRVLVAVEGSGWPVPPSEVAKHLRCELIDVHGEPRRVPLTSLQPGDGGWARVVHGTAQAPGASFAVRVMSPVSGTIEGAVTALPGRVTVLALTLTADGRAEQVQHLLRVPGQEYEEPVSEIGYDRFLREMVLGQQLYASGELLERVDQRHDSADRSFLRRLVELLYAKWTDPILGCMAYLALIDMAARGLPDRFGLANAREVAARNLYHYFGDLPDARVIAAHAGVDGAPPLGEALAPGEVPVLAQALRLVASASGSRQDDYRHWLRFVSPTSPWALTWRPETDVAPLNRMTLRV